MKKVSRYVVLWLLFFMVISGTALAKGAVTGTVVDKDNKPIAGLMVYIVHHTGRSCPSVTDNSGYFLVKDIPLRSDRYYLEIYWGEKLVYRNTVIVNVDKIINLNKIVLK